MSDRSDFYYEQEVTQAELDQAFDDVENADRNLLADQEDSANAFSIFGVANGLTVAQTSTPSLSVEIADGVAYDVQGRRIPHSGGPYTLDLTSLQPGSDQRYVRIYAEFNRDLSDPRTDGLGGAIDYRQTEGVVFSADAGAISASPVKPAVLTGKILIATVLMVNGLLVTDARISLGTPTATDADGDRQEGGFAVAHAKQNPTNRKILYASGGDEVIDLNGNHIRARGGEIYLDRGTIRRAEQVQAEGPPDPASGVGFLYVDPSSADEFGDLLTLTKYASWDATAMLPFIQAGISHPWQGGALPNNQWFIESLGPVPLNTYDLRWGMETDNAGFPYYEVGLGCALTGLPQGAKLTAVEFGVEVTSVVAGMQFGVGVYRRSRAATGTNLINVGGVITLAAMPGVGATWVANDAIDTAKDIIDPQDWAYYAVFIPYSTTAQTNQDIGVKVGLVRATYQIREASGVY